MKPRTSLSLRRAICLCVVASVVSWSGGCTLTVGLPAAVTGSLLSDINGWDLSACSNGRFLTCAELFSDNQQLILGGRTTGEVVLQGVMGILSTLDQVEVSLGRPRS